MRDQQRRNDNKPNIDKIRSPYNFVPLARDVVLPDWSDEYAQDIPFPDGISGSFDLCIEAQTPIFVYGSTKENVKHFYRLEGNKGQYGIPGTSIRGMLRNMVQILTFSKMNPVNNHTYGVRDLQNRKLYGEHMAEADGGGLHPLVCAGWLTQGEDEYEDGTKCWYIEPCNFAKVEYSLIEGYAKSLGIQRYNPGRKQSSVDKYNSWNPEKGTKSKVWSDRWLKASALVDVIDQHGRESKTGIPRVGDYGVVKKLGQSGQVDGTLVFTGQPSTYQKGEKRKKHHDFFFYGDVEEPILVEESIRDAFEFVHSDGRQQHRLDVGHENPEWKYLKAAFTKGKKVPVFFLLNKAGKLRAMGLAMMFRLAYANSVKGLIRQNVSEPQKPDLTELIFGRVSTLGQDTIARRGRISIETAVAMTEPKVLPEVVGVLGGPKASYYPNYVSQIREKKLPSGTEYQTYMNTNQEATIRGWKRYYNHEQVAQLSGVKDISNSSNKHRDKDKVQENKEGKNVETRFLPLKEGAKFKARVHIHNLRRKEFGAILWALTFGGDEECFHQLGMAKSYGYGRVRLSIDNVSLETWEGMEAGEDLPRVTADSFANLQQEFMQYMNSQLGDVWQATRQVLSLKQMAKVYPNSDDLRHMVLKSPVDGRTNEFVAAKKDKLVLNPVISENELQVLQKEFAEERKQMAAEAEERRKQAELEKQQAKLDAMSPYDRAEAEFHSAADRQGQLALLKQWLEDTEQSEEFLEARKHVAWTLYIKEKKGKWRQKNKDLVEWARPRQ